MSLNNVKRPNNSTREALIHPLPVITAIAATAVLPLCTFGADFYVGRFEVEVPGGYTADAANYYDISLQSKPAVTTAVAATDTLTSAGHGLSTGDSVQFTNSGGGLPAGLTAGVTYFAIVLTADTFKVSDTLAHALAGTNVIDITTAGTGVQSFAKLYAMYSLKTGGNGTLVDLVFANGTVQSTPSGPSGQQLNVVCTKFGTAANLPVNTRFVAHCSTL